MKHYIICPIIIGMLCLPMFALGQIKSNVQSVSPDSDLKTMDLPKRKTVQKEEVAKPVDRPKRKTKKNTTEANNTMRDILGEQTSSVIAQATLVNAYEVESFVSENPADETLEGFKILQMATLDEHQTNWIKQLVLSQETYFFTEKQKQCLFLPKMGLQFVTGKDTSNILVSFKCDFTRFYQGSPTTLHSDYGHEDFMEFYKTIFPTDFQDQFAAQPVLLKKENSKEVNTKMTKEIAQKPIYYTVQLGDSWVVVAQKATNTILSKVTVDDLCEWNEVNPTEAKSNKRFLLKGETIIVGFKR